MAWRCHHYFEHNIAQMLVIALMLIIHAMGDSAEEKQKCAKQLTGTALCLWRLPYVGGDAKAPTPDCCSGLKQVIIKNKKCLCLIIKDRDDLDLGLKINITLALGLPSLCKASDNVSQCPNPKSVEAQAFNPLGQNSNSNGGSINPSSSPHGNDAFKTDEGTTVTSLPIKNHAAYEGLGMRLLESLVAGLLIWIFLV